MKKFNRAVHKSMGELPPALRQLIGDSDVATATAEFKEFLTALATEFHAQLSMDIAPPDINLRAPMKLFGQTVSLDYIASGSVGSVYKMQIGSVFEYNGRKYSWILSDFVENDRVDGFESAMEKLYFAYITKGISINDAHPKNFKDGRLIDTPSLGMRDMEYDDIKKLTRVQVDIVKKLAYCIKTDDMSRFKSLVARAITENPAVITYMFFAMKYAKGPTFAVGKTDDFSMKLRRYEAVINSAKHQIAPPNPVLSAVAQKIINGHKK